jgi:hypothetical protein
MDVVCSKCHVFIAMPSVVTLNAVMLNVVAPLRSVGSRREIKVASLYVVLHRVSHWSMKIWLSSVLLKDSSEESFF